MSMHASIRVSSIALSLVSPYAPSHVWPHGLDCGASRLTGVRTASHAGVAATAAEASQAFCSSSDRSGPPGTAIGSSATPQNVPWFGPAVPDRVVLHQASENTVRYSIRSRKAQLSPISRLVGRVGRLGRSVTAAYRIAPRAAQPGARQGPVLLGNRRILRNGQAWLVRRLSCRSLDWPRILARVDSVLSRAAAAVAVSALLPRVHRAWAKGFRSACRILRITLI